MDASEEFRWMFAAEYPAVVRTVSFVLRDGSVAEEIAQEAFVRLLQHWEKVSRYERPGAWVRRVAIRLAVREVRRQRMRPVLERRAAPLTPAAPPAESIDPDLMDAIRRLPARQRAVVVLFYLEDWPMAEIADILDCSPATCWVHLHRARKRLAALLGEEVDEHVH